MKNYQVKLMLQAMQGNSQAQYQLGIYYCIQGNEKKAIYWLKRAERHGHYKAMDFLKEISEHKISYYSKIYH